MMRYSYKRIKIGTALYQGLKTDLFLLLLIVGLFSCNKEIQTAVLQDSEAEQVYHGFLYIGCAVPPYYMNFDSLVTHCSAEGPLPEILPSFTLNSDTTPQFCRFDGNEAWIGTANNFDIDIKYQNNSILTEVSTNWTDVVSEAIPVNIEGVEYQAGEGSYLGGYRFTSASAVATVQVVNAYVGGCFHNVVIWEKKSW